MTSRPAVRPVVEVAIRVNAAPGTVIAVARSVGEPEFLAVGTDGAGRSLTLGSLIPVA
jgi:hypothetical protein